MQLQNPVDGDWEYLIVLDACRYDYFERLYEQFLDGDLEKRRSAGSATPEWLQNTFPDQYDITYVSANAFINSQGVSLEEYGGYTANEHFEQIVDVWDDGWDPELGTVHPDTLVDAVVEYDPDPRSIIHFVQPHGPYLTTDDHFSSRVGKKEPDHFGGGTTS